MWTSPLRGCPSDICFALGVPAPVEGQTISFERVDGGDAPVLDWASVDQRIDYPEFAWRAAVGGTVVLRMVVSPSGEVTSLGVAQSPDPSLSDAALRAFRDARDVSGSAPTTVEVAVTFRHFNRYVGAV